MTNLPRHIGENDRYRLEQRIGAGAMGTVYLATDSKFQRQVVVKILEPHLATNAKVRTRFKNEALIQANIIHPNIVRAVDVVETGADFGIVMDYVPGADLDGYLATRGGRLPVAEAIALLDPILDALGRAHQQGVVHRDLKPGNILIDMTGPKPEPRIADFGIAKIIREDAPAMTRTGAVLGTPLYMPPEQLRGVADLDLRADIYAAGVMLYQMVTGALPYAGESEYEVTHQVLSGAPVRPPSACAPGVPASLDRVVATAMAADRANRYPDAASFRAALTACMGGHAPTPAAFAAVPPTHPPVQPTQYEVANEAPRPPPPPAPNEAPSGSPQAAPGGMRTVALVAAALVVSSALVVAAVILSRAENPARSSTDDSGTWAATQVAAHAKGEAASDNFAPAARSADFGTKSAQQAPPERLAPGSPPIRDVALCNEGEALSGSWRFTSRVVGSSHGGGIGVNGHYEMEIGGDHCRPRVRITKAGYAKVRFSYEKQQVGSSVFRPEPMVGQSGQGTFDIVLAKRGGGGPLSMRIHLVASASGRLYGTWRYLGASWAESGFWGALRGTSGSTDPGPLGGIDDQPCHLACELICHGLDDEAPAYAAARARCQARCVDDPHGRRFCQ